MNYCSLPGVTCPSPEPWQLFMCAFIGWSSLMTIAGVSIEAYRWHIHDMPKWLQLLSALVLLHHHPISIAILLSFFAMFCGVAPWGASLLVAGYGLYGYATFWYFLMGPKFWQATDSR